MTATPSSDKLAIKLGGNADLAEALVAAGLKNPVAIENAEDGVIEDAVGSENLATVRTAFPAPEQ